ncbi:MAG: C2 domain-containing protein [Oculatellaceae cyanobacterium Prado106]|jgi:hypothetical protein|nr:C2 domain-containing protein [Oculatellaceae cyanobacterium Prado106]
MSNAQNNTEKFDVLTLQPQLKITLSEVHDDDGDVEGNGADFYAKVWIEGSLVGNTAVFDNNNNHIYPNWEFTKIYPLSHYPTTIPIQIQIFDQDTVYDDQVDINPNRGETLHLYLDTNLRQVTGDGIQGYQSVGDWIAIGEDDTGDDARIQFKVDWK